MWSLPDINRLNSEAYRDKKRFEDAVKTGRLDGKQLTCECGGWGADRVKECGGELYHYLWYDIFSDDPKGVLTLCERHDNYFGSPTEGYFTCDDCERVMIENYTWERYSTIVNECEELCLPCAAKRYIAEESNWIELTPENIANITFDQHIRKAPHIIGVRMPVPKEIEFVGNVEFDSSTGGRVRTMMSADTTPTMGEMEMREALLDAMNKGHKRALLIMDAAYQFAVSIGVYVDADTATSQAA